MKDIEKQEQEVIMSINGPINKYGIYIIQTQNKLYHKTNTITEELRNAEESFTHLHNMIENSIMTK